MNTNLAIKQNETRYFNTGVDAIDFSPKPNFVVALSSRSNELSALLVRHSARNRQLIKATFGPVYQDLLKVHGHNKALNMAQRELDKALDMHEKKYVKKRNAILKKYEAALSAAKHF